MRSSIREGWPSLLLVALLLATASRPLAAADPIAELRVRIDAGEVTLDFDQDRGYLPALLAELDVPVSSQVLIFSRTSLQTDRIAPWAPRAVYFNDDVYVGWVQESPIIEIAAIDPIEGAVFYTLAQRAEGPPRFEVEGTTCLMCHESRITEGVPGLIMRSVLTDRLGYPVTDIHQGQTTHRTPMEERWGGWYVTGTHQTPGHAGNRRADQLDEEIFNRAEYLAAFDLNSGGNVADLSDRFDVVPYLSPHSDIVSLMVLAHQVEIHNLITLVHREGTRSLGGLAAQKGAQSGSAGGRSVAAVDRLVRAMLFEGEIELMGPIRGTSDFTKAFAEGGVRGESGRSFRDFDLRRRLFRYPLSYLIHSDAFESMPAFAKHHVYDRLNEVLSADDPGPEFHHLSAEDRAVMLEILRETTPAFAERHPS